MTDHTALGALRAAFEILAPKAATLSPADLTMLQGRVFAAVDEFRASGVLLERVIVAIQGLAADAGIQLTGLPLRQRLETWCIERYSVAPPD